MKSIGEAGADPEGNRWAPNTRVTIERFLTKQSGNFGKSGRITKKGAERAGNKRPLLGISKSLSNTINYSASNEGVDIGSPMIYAATQQFGAPKGSFKGGKSPWGNIPARPFLGLSQSDQQLISDSTLDYLESLLS